MRGGKLDRWIVIQTLAISQSSSGEPVEAWSSLAKRPASYRPLDGIERYADAQFVGRDQVEFTIRYALSVASLKTTARVIFPASSALDSPLPESALYDVLAIQQTERNESIRIIAARRPDVSP